MHKWYPAVCQFVSRLVLLLVLCVGATAIAACLHAGLRPAVRLGRQFRTLPNYSRRCGSSALLRGHDDQTRDKSNSPNIGSGSWLLAVSADQKSFRRSRRGIDHADGGHG